MLGDDGETGRPGDVGDQGEPGLPGLQGIHTKNIFGYLFYGRWNSNSPTTSTFYQSRMN